MFPSGLPTLPSLNSGRNNFIISGGGDGGFGGGFPGSSGGGIDLGNVFRGGGNPASGGGTSKSISLPSSPLGIGASLLSNVLGIPAINWGRIAAFLLGLLLIAGGIYLIRPVQNVVNQTVKKSAKAALAA